MKPPQHFRVEIFVDESTGECRSALFYFMRTGFHSSRDYGPFSALYDLGGFLFGVDVSGRCRLSELASIPGMDQIAMDFIRRTAPPGLVTDDVANTDPLTWQYQSDVANSDVTTHE